MVTLTVAQQHEILKCAHNAVFCFSSQYLGHRGRAPHFTLDEIDDIVGETVFRACRSFGHYDPEKARLSTWVSSIARNCVIDAVGRSMKQKLVCDPLISEDFYSEYEADRSISSAEFENRIESEIGKLSERNQHVAHMVMEGYSNKDIAAADDSSVNAVAKRVCMIRKTLAAQVSGIACEFDIYYPKFAS
ncbi:MAG: sigma-70 family RNA polymerase sigma factor [Bacteroidales bacterium]|nr:sigma-70 family RNA polymerase sigma factor [Bacteroidales bacterium]